MCGKNFILKKTDKLLCALDGIEGSVRAGLLILVHTKWQTFKPSIPDRPVRCVCLAVFRSQFCSI